MSENFYNILGVSENASKDEIKKAYRSLQMKYHPDKNQGNTESHKMTQTINEAYETLGDKQKKEEYDMILDKKDETYLSFTDFLELMDKKDLLKLIEDDTS